LGAAIISPHLILLRSAEATAAVTAHGGCLAAYAVGGFDILRPLRDQQPGRVDPRATGGFPLVPYSNRIKAGRFRFQGIDFRLPLNSSGHPHSMHGVGWQSPWHVERQDDDRVVLTLDYSGDGWPFAFTARHTVALQGADLRIDLALTNRSDRPMPAGLGLHPYFPRHGGATLQAGVTHVWLTDATGLPKDRVPCPDGWGLAKGTDVANLHCDNQFEPWDRHARIAWPADGMVVDLTASDGLNRLGVYAPGGQDFLCVEPISHITDAVNRATSGRPAAETGMRILDPGESWQVWCLLSPRSV